MENIQVANRRLGRTYRAPKITVQIFREKKFLRRALIISLIIHIVSLITFSYCNTSDIAPPVKKRAELAYMPVRYAKSSRGSQTVTSRGISRAAIKSNTTKIAMNSPNLMDNASVHTSPFSKDTVDIPANLQMETKPVSKLTTVSTALSTKISMSELKSENISNPSYTIYKQMVRSKIDARVHINYSGRELGKVYVAFVLLADGTVQQVKIPDDKASGNPYLKEVVARSMQEVSPFPPFPKDLKYPELSFNVMISFEAGD